MSGDRDQKTEKPTARRKREARRNGQIPRSQDVVAWSMLLIGTFVLGSLVTQGHELGRELMEGVRQTVAEPEEGRMLVLLGEGLRGLVTLVAPVLLGLVGVAVVGNVAQVGLVFTTKPFKPKLDRLNPLKGVKRLFSVRGLWELGKSLAKVSVIALVAWPAFRDLVGDLVGREQLGLGSLLPFVAGRTMGLVRRIAAVGLLLALGDYAYQRRRVMKDLKMTKQEVREEQRNSEGNPEIKAKIRSQQLAMSRNRMISNVATADAVVVNPVHLAIALRYVPGAGAPRVVAKGAGAVAERIRDEAEKHGVPIVEAIPLARALHKACELDDEIPVELYEGVARLLAFVHRIRPGSAFGGHHILTGV